MSGALSICVLIPAYNARPFLREALDSVLTQTRPPEQIIVIDDGSTDGTADVALAWQAERRRPITLIRQSNGGQSAARNAGLRVARTDLVALLDADDLYLPDHLQRLEQGFREAPQSVVCFGDAEEFTASGVTRPSYVAGTRIETVPTERRRGGLRLMTESAFSSLLWGNYIPTAATMFRRAAALRVGLFDERFRGPEDREFLLRLSRLGPFSYYPMVLARKREHGANATRPSRVLQFNREQFRVLRNIESMADALRLRAVERGAVRRAMADHIADMQYTASTWGPGGYLTTCLFLARHGVLGPLVKPRPLIRALVWPLLRQKHLKRQKDIAVLRA
jgi:glycosyltransferase involved in cell wall biosynthesis